MLEFKYIEKRQKNIHQKHRNRSPKMYYKITVILSLVCCVVIMAGCAVLLSPQEWSDNYALLDGTQATNIEMIDGDINTVGVTSPTNRSNTQVGRTPAPEIIVTLPEKKIIRKVVIYSDNIKNFVLYADKGGSAISGTDWQMIKTVQRVKSNPIVIPVLYSFPTNRIRLSVLGTTDDTALTRKKKAERSRNIASISDCDTSHT